jgi:hypothetical protein
MGGIFNTANSNLYHYGGNNPVKYTDPDGKWRRNSHGKIKFYTAAQLDARHIAHSADWGTPGDSSPNFKHGFIVTDAGVAVDALLYIRPPTTMNTRNALGAALHLPVSIRTENPANVAAALREQGYIRRPGDTVQVGDIVNRVDMTTGHASMAGVVTAVSYLDPSDKSLGRLVDFSYRRLNHNGRETYKEALMGNMTGAASGHQLRTRAWYKPDSGYIDGRGAASPSDVIARRNQGYNRHTWGIVEKRGHEQRERHDHVGRPRAGRHGKPGHG